MRNAPPILCFGEVLWDCFPDGRRLGGAPVNVAYHLRQLGARPVPVTAVGEDDLGDEIVGRLDRWGIETVGVTRDSSRPTGTVRVRLDEEGNATYEVVRNVAWDAIGIPESLVPVAVGSLAVVFGSLAQRSEANRRALRQVRALARSARLVFDVNLRPTFEDLREVRRLAGGADLVKVNHEELGILAGREPVLENLEALARQVGGECGSRRLCVTAGRHGAGLLWEGPWHWEPGREVAVRDTVGAGDAFLAAFLVGWLKGSVRPEDLLRRPCRLAEFVATRAGATPEYGEGAPSD